MAPDGNFVLREGDRIFVTAPTGNMTILLKSLGIITHKVKKVMICGGGRICYYLAQMLQKSGIQVRIIEKDYEKCLELAGKLPDATIIHGDASSQALLESEGVKDCDALVTMTGMDEQNIIISLYGNSCGVPQVITKVGHLEHTQIIGDLPLGSVISPKELCTDAIVRYVRAMHNQTGAAITLYSIADGHAEALEFLVEQGTKYCGVPLKDIKVKKNVLIVGISHRARTEIPNGESFFDVGDNVIVVSSREEVIYQLNDIFE
jgi:trk system potassium uptake protein TrkA